MSHYPKKTQGIAVLKTVISSAAPIVIIGGLLYAGLFVKVESKGKPVERSAIERRDLFFGVAAPSENVVWAAGTGGKIVRSEDGGNTWVRQETGTTANLQGVAAWDDKQAIAVGNRGLIFYTADGGASWKAAKTPDSGDNPNKLLKVRVFGDTAWAVGEFGALLRSNDRGATWESALPAKDLAWNDVYFVGQKGWLVGEFGSIMHTEDGGATWTEMVSENKTSLMSVAFRDEKNGVAVGMTGTMLSTQDGGATWASLQPVTREHLYNVIWDADHWVAVGDKGVKAVGSEDGVTWKAERVFEKDVAWRTQIVKSGDKYYVAGANLGILQNNGLTIVGRPKI